MEQEPKDRTVRVFISSTFRDMHAERDHLVTVIFPQLRRLCESRGVTWGEIDLRWGVTDEAAAEGKVLPICLEEIQRCRPYFIGLLGERYGWVPDSIPAELLEKEAWLREPSMGLKSVTELEILHGVLRNPEMAGHAFFYFRDPAWLHRLPPNAPRADFVSEDAASAAMLAQLKQDIRASRLPLRENYPDPKALGELVLADLTKVIDDRFPAGSEPDPLSRVELDHAAYARSRQRVYIGRPESFARLDAHAGGTGDQPLVIIGDSGSGKSALLANWAAGYRKAHPDAFVLEHYIGAAPASADWEAMLRRVLGEFKQRLGIEQEIPDHPEAIRGAFPRWLHMAAAKGRIVLVLDALNQLEDRDGAHDLLWLPPVLPENVRMIVSTLPGRTLDEIQKRHWPEFKVEPLQGAERRQLITEYLAQFSKVLAPAQLDRIADAPPAANPLYLRVLLDELRVFGQHERLEERIGYYLRAASPHGLYRKVLARWEEHYEGDTDLVGDTLSLLWAARSGLAEAEILDALGSEGRPLSRAAWSPLFLAMADAMCNRGGLLTFAHDFLRTAARDAYLPTPPHQQQAHLRLADYFERQPPGPRRTDELPWQLAEARAWQRLRDLLADREFFTEAWDRNQFEVRTFWAQIEAGSPLRMVEAYGAQIGRPEAEPDKAYLSRLDMLLDNTGHVEEALRLRSAMVGHFRDSGDWNNLQTALGNQANSLYARGELDEAMTLYDEQEQICRRLGYADGLHRAVGHKASILADRGDLDGALALHKEKERICRQLDNQAGLAGTLGSQGMIVHERGDLAGALALHKEEERIYRQLGKLDGLAVSLGHQASILFERGDGDGAMALHGEEERICRQLGDLDTLWYCLCGQGAIFHTAGRLDEATAKYEEVERICRQLGNLKGLQASLGNQGLILQARGDQDGALKLLKEQERICQQTGYLDGLQRAIGNQANSHLLRGDLDGAMARLKEQEQICRKVGNVDSLATSLSNQALVLLRTGRAREGLPLAEEAYRLASTHGYALRARQFEPLLRDLRQTAQGGEMNPPGVAPRPTRLEPPPSLRAVIEEMEREPSKVKEIAARLQRENPTSFAELIQWIDTLRRRQAP